MGNYQWYEIEANRVKVNEWWNKFKELGPPFSNMEECENVKIVVEEIIKLMSSKDGEINSMFFYKLMKNELENENLIKLNNFFLGKIGYLSNEAVKIFGYNYRENEMKKGIMCDNRKLIRENITYEGFRIDKLSEKIQYIKEPIIYDVQNYNYFIKNILKKDYEVFGKYSQMTPIEVNFKTLEAQELFSHAFLEIINYNVCHQKLDNRIEILNIILTKIKSFNVEIENEIEEIRNIKFKKEETLEEIYELFLEYFLFIESFQKDFFQVKVQKKIIENDVMEKYKSVTEEEVIEFFYSELSEEKIPLTEKLKQLSDGKKNKDNHFKEKLERIQESVDALNLMLGRSLDIKNLKNLKAIYQELFKSSMVIPSTRRTTKQAVLHFLKKNKEYIKNVEIARKAEGIRMDIKNTVVFKEDILNSEKLKKYREKEEKMRKNYLNEISKEEVVFLNEKINRGMFLVEGMEEEYKISKEISCKILESFDLIKNILNSNKKSLMTEKYIKENFCFFEKLIKKYNLDNYYIEKL